MVVEVAADVAVVRMVVRFLDFVEDLTVSEVSTSRGVVTGLVTTEADFLGRLRRLRGGAAGGGRTEWVEMSASFGIGDSSVG
jgi:hypothetical protein